MVSRHLLCAKLSARVYKHWDARTAGIESLTNEDKSIIAFAGTDVRQPQDVLRDLRIIPLWSPDLGLSPAGFLKAARRLGYIVLDHLADNRMESVTLTGHSLGGAVALITAALIARECPGDKKVREVVTFGAPRVGRLRTLDCPITQYRYQNDIVPTVPWLMPRPGKLTQIGDNNTRGNWISDHGIMNYINELRRRDLESVHV